MNPGLAPTSQVNATQTPAAWITNEDPSPSGSQVSCYHSGPASDEGATLSSAMSTLSLSSGSRQSSRRGSPTLLAPVQAQLPKPKSSYGLVDESVLDSNPHIKTEQFRVDRRKLEALIGVATEIFEINSATVFFAKVMFETSTTVEWPRNLKLNGKYQKNPIVKVYGLAADIAWAKRTILSVLATRGPLLRLKVHICKLDHPHIIGRRGDNINEMMKSTETRIHFADLDKADQSNSHHVAILGTFESLEKARFQLRQSTPLIMKLKIHLKRHSFRRGLAEHLEKLEGALRVEIATITIRLDKMYLVTVKGTEKESQNVKTAVHSLINTYLSSYEAQSVFLEFIIAPEVRAALTDNSEAVLCAIRRTTRTDIAILPVDERQMSKVVVRGTTSAIHEAKKAIVGYYPVELVFDIDDEQGKDTFSKLCRQYGLEGRIKPKDGEQPFPFRATARTHEQYAKRLYAAYRDLPNLKDYTPGRGIPGGLLRTPRNYTSGLDMNHKRGVARGPQRAPRNNRGRLHPRAPVCAELAPRLSPDPNDSDDWAEYSPEDLEVASYMSLPHCISPPPSILDEKHVPAPVFNRAPGAERRRRC